MKRITHRIAGFCLIAAAGVLVSAPSSAQQLAFAPQYERPRNVIDAIFGAFRRPEPRVVYNYAPPVPPARITPHGRSQDGIANRSVQPTRPALAAPRSTTKTAAGGMSRRTGGGGSLAVCVRTCDGYFFPVNYEGARGDDRFAEACQASCPNAETEVYFKPPGADMQSAANAQGRNYTQLPNAFKYRTQRDNSCSCKGAGQTWAEALKGAEDIVGTRKNDIIVTQEQSEQMARPANPAKPGKSADATARAESGSTAVR